jgi:rRNA-processing protein FCF1
MDSMVHIILIQFDIGIVIDTNYYLEHLEFLKNLLEIIPSNIIFYIPFIVSQELDGLKVQKD